MGVGEPGVQATDVLLFVFHTDKDDEPTKLVTYTQHKVGEVSQAAHRRQRHVLVLVQCMHS